MTTQAEPMAASRDLACLEVWGGNEPADTVVRVPGLDVWVYAAPFANADAGGDVHFISSCGTGRIARLLVADVAGHGQEVAQTARTLRSLIRRYMNHIDQRRFVTAMNQQFTEMTQTGRFATAVAMTYYAPTSELSVCNAGHPPPLVFHAKSRTWTYVESEGEEASAAGAMIENIPLGIEGTAAYEQFRVDLAAGDLVLCYTDSLIESVCRDGSLLGPERLLELVRSIAPADPARLIHQLLAKLSDSGAVLNDDVTLLLSRCSGTSPGAGFAGRILAQLKFLGQIVTLRRNIPWPEISARNLLGAASTKIASRKS